MKVLFLNEHAVHELLDMRACIQLMHDALSTMARGDAVLPLRSMVRLPDGSGILGLMPGYLGEPRSFGLKVVTVMPGNHGTEYDSHQGVVMLFGIEHGEPLAILDASAITAIRTAAASAAATDVLAQADAGDLALIGSGTQARSHLHAMRAVRPLRRVRVWSRTYANAEQFAREQGAVLAERSDSAAPVIEVCSTVEDAVDGADLICTTTSAKEPVLLGRWLASGTHVNAVGACFAASRELDTEAVARSRFFTDCRESCLAEAGDFRLPRLEGAIPEAHLLGELGDVFLGRLAGRTGPEDITVYESLGIALEDLAAAHFLLRRARESGAGTWLEWGGPPDA
ncbi:MAG: ornithine cyclodeaminase family protein [Candidatus Eisenbacteria bacterium]